MKKIWRNPTAPSVVLLALAFTSAGVRLSSAAATPDAHTVDVVTAGDEGSEKGHKFQGEQTTTQQLNSQTFRVADTNGWFSWELKALPNAAQELDVEFGGERRRPNDTVDVLANDVKLATVRLAGGPRAEYYPLTNSALNGKEILVVKFQAATGSRVGGVANVSIVKIPDPTIASSSTASSTRTNWQFIVNAVNDRHEPKSSGDRLKKHFDWWPAKNTNQWVQYDFAKPSRVSAVEVYWFDDTGIGECRPPKSWRVLYRENGEWKPVAHASGYGCEKDHYNRATFDAVETDGLRLDVEMPENFSSGLLQWKVE